MASLIAMLPDFLTTYETNEGICKIIAFYFVASLVTHFLSGVISAATLPHYNE